jgi:hypothetical protein
VSGKSNDNGFDYDRMVEDAMRGVARDALRSVATRGLPGKHHFYITFRTDAPGVEMAARLRALYPREMTIVIQHQFWNLVAYEDAFAIELAFSGKRERLYVPLAALTAFADPEAKFGLTFGAGGETRKIASGAASKGAATSSRATKAGTAAGSDGKKVVSLEQFRKK